jgi:hypothetical protein
MKTMIAMITVLTISPFAQAEEEVKGQVIEKLNITAEYRARYQFDQSPTGIKEDASGNNKQPGNQDAVAHRFKLGTTFKSSEKLSATLTLLHNANWGATDLNGDSTSTGHSPTGDDRAIPNGTNDAENMLLVNEAYGVWQVSDSMAVKFGRGSLTLGDGNLISANDWQATPYAFEGVIASYMTEAADLAVFAVRYAEWQRGSNEKHNDDPESNSYGMSVDIKSLPEVFKLVNLHVQQNDLDEIYCAEATSDGGACDPAGTASLLPRASTLRYGAAIAGQTGGFDFHLNYEAEQGNTRLGTLEGSIAASMYQVELGWSLPETMNTRIYALYHSDTGDDNNNVGGDSNADTSEDDVSRQRYDGFFYEQHRNAGLMDVLAWGNLTYYSLGFTMEPLSEFYFGVHYHVFSRTTVDDSVQFQGANTGFNGSGNGGLLSNGYSAAADVDEELAIGQEVDVVITQNYDGGFSLTAQAGVFMPGAHLKNAEATADESIEEAYTQIMVEGLMTF